MFKYCSLTQIVCIIQFLPGTILRKNLFHFRKISQNVWDTLHGNVYLGQGDVNFKEMLHFIRNLTAHIRKKTRKFI